VQREGEVHGRLGAVEGMLEVGDGGPDTDTDAVTDALTRAGR
jgi:hypothetical protein